MKLFGFNIERNKDHNEIEGKQNFDVQDLPPSQLYQYLFGILDVTQLNLNIPPRTAYELSVRNNDLGDAIDRIASAISAFQLGLQQGTDITYESDLLTLLQNPGGGYSGMQFLYNIIESFLLTDEAWVVVRGRQNARPLELTFIRPYDVNVTFSDGTGLPLIIQTTSNRDRRVYEAEESNGLLRFFSRDGLNELIPIIGKVSMIDDWRGQSSLTQLFYDTKMSTAGKQHNLSLLNNGLTTSGVMSPPSVSDNNLNRWNKETIKAMEESLRKFNQGSGNAGNIMISTRPLQVQGLSQTNKDMDYAELLKGNREAIYNHYKIPLPLVLSDTMTLDNYTAAQRSFYYQAVFPVFERLMPTFMNYIRSRFNLQNNVDLIFNDKTIRELRNVNVENMTQLNNTNSVSLNEVRNEGGFEPNELGDEIYVNANTVPLSAVGAPVTFTNDDIEQEMQEGVTDEQ